MPPELDPADVPGDGAVTRPGRDDDGTAAVDDGSDGRARGPPDRAGEALVDPPPPPRARRQDPVGRRLATCLRLRRPRGGGARRPRGGRPDRRLDARQAARARARRRRVPGPAVPESDVDAQTRPGALRRADERRRADHGRRHDQPARRRDVLRDDDLQWGRRRRAVVLVVARRLEDGRHPDRHHAVAVGRQPRRAAGA